ncbi:MAG: formylmethanofuran dehydrogenase subunit C [Promethearchaeota archaeon]
MAEVKLKLKKEPEVAIEAEAITPDNFAGKSADEIKKITVYLGNQEVPIGDLFDVSGNAGEKDDTKIVIDSNCTMVKRIGEKMTGGEIIVNGNVGMHIGNNMSGGKIIVNGNASDWAGAMMQGGELEITGDAGHYVGAAYRGYWQGMKGGIIRVKGKVGNESLLWANGSRIAKRFPTLYCGSAAQFLGLHNHGATIIVEGDVDRCVGADQVKGTIVIKGKAPKILPSFKKVGEVNDITLFNGETIKGKFIEYSGDHSVKKNHSVKKKGTEDLNIGVNGRLYVAQ